MIHRNRFDNVKLVAVDLKSLNWQPLSIETRFDPSLADQSLIEVVKSRDIDRARELLDQGIDINIRDRYGRSAILWAVALDNGAMVDLIFEHDVDFSVQDMRDWSIFNYLEVLLIGGARANVFKVTRAAKKGFKDN